MAIDLDPDRVRRMWARAPEIEGAGWGELSVAAQALYIGSIMWCEDNGTQGTWPPEAMPEIAAYGRAVLAIVGSEGNGST
jgi:hypothetical protein